MKATGSQDNLLGAHGLHGRPAQGTQTGTSVFRPLAADRLREVWGIRIIRTGGAEHVLTRQSQSPSPGGLEILPETQSSRSGAVVWTRAAREVRNPHGFNVSRPRSSSESVLFLSPSPSIPTSSFTLRRVGWPWGQRCSHEAPFGQFHRPWRLLRGPHEMERWVKLEDRR